MDPDDGCLTYSEDPGDLKRKEFMDDDDDVDYGDSWEDAGFEELDDLDLEDEESYN